MIGRALHALLKMVLVAVLMTALCALGAGTYVTGFEIASAAKRWTDRDRVVSVETCAHAMRDMANELEKEPFLARERMPADQEFEL